MRHLRQALILLLAWAAPAAPGPCLAAESQGVAECERQFIVRPDEPEAARCFWRQADRKQAAQSVRRLLLQYPNNPGLEMCAAVLGLVPSDLAENLLRSAAGRYFHHNAEGEVLARENLVLLLLSQGAIDEADQELRREATAASACSPPLRDHYLALATMTRAWFLFKSGDLEQAGLVLDQIPAGPLRDARWLQMAGNVHLYRGELEKAWDDCRFLSLPTLRHSQRADGLYCQVKVLIVRASELPAESISRQIMKQARAARQEAELGGNLTIASWASWPLILAAESAEAAKAEYRRCLDAANDDPAQRICRRAFVRWQSSSARTASTKPDAGLSGIDLNDPISRAEGYGDLMRESWKARPFESFVHEAWQALSEIELLRAQQPGAEIQTSLLSVWSDDYYWFLGRLLEAALVARCPSCLDLAFDVVERLRARALYDSLVAARAGAPAERADRARLAALARAIERVKERRQDMSIPTSERESAESDLKAFIAREQRLRQQRGLAGGPGDSTPASPAAGEAIISQGLPSIAAASGPAAVRALPGQAGSSSMVASPGSPRFTTLAQVQQLLGSDQALLSFQVAPWKDWTGDFGGGSWLVVVTKATRRCYRLEIGRGDVRRAVADFFERRSRSQSWQATELYRQLLGPALSEIPPSIKRLIIIPDDHLHRLPFGALREAPGGPPLVWRYQIAIVPSATLWARWRTARPPLPADRPALVLADPPPPLPAVQQRFLADGIHLPAQPLPAARREADALVRFLGWRCERRVGKEAAESALLDARTPLGRYALVHFAAHSIVDDRDPGRSGIWLSPSSGHDGLLREADIVKLRLDDRLVVLSTCSSNGGPFLRGEGVMSLAHAFFQARVRTVVATLWPQVDTDAEALLAGFYRYLSQGASVAAALRQAQLDLLRKDPRLPPVAWAGMVVLGDGDLVPFPGGRHPWRVWWLIGVAVAVILLASVLALLGVRAR